MSAMFLQSHEVEKLDDKMLEHFLILAKRRHSFDGREELRLLTEEKARRNIAFREQVAKNA
jgi:hypothetical protein